MSIRSKLRALFLQRRRDADMVEEMRLHLEQRTEEHVAAGMPPEEARYAALRKFGGVEQAKELARSQRAGVWLEQAVQDVRHAWRTLRHQPGFTMVVLTTLALGIGMNTAIFSLLDAVLWKVLPVAAPQELVLLERFPIRSGVPGLPGRKFSDISYPLMRALAEPEGVLVEATTFRTDAASVRVHGENEPATILKVADNFYSVLGLRPATGRLIQPGDGRRAEGVVLSHGYWRRRFGGKEVAGEAILVNGMPYTVLGVTPPEFFGLVPGSTFDVCIAMSERELAANPGASIVDPNASPLGTVLARLSPGMGADQATLALTGRLRALMKSNGQEDASEAHRIEARPASRGLDRLRNQFSKPLLASMGLVALVLVTLCANLANLLLARAAARQRESAIRLAMGATRGRLIRQMLAESLLLALGGAALGWAVAAWTNQLLLGLAASGARPVTLAAPLDGRVFGFTLGVAVTSGLLFGGLPAWNASRHAAGAIFGRMAQARPALGLGKWLIVVQVALSLVLLAGAGLFVRSFQNLVRADVGFRRENILLIAVDPRLAGKQGAELAQLYERIVARLSLLPGVAAVTLERNVPLSGASTIGQMHPAGFTPPEGPKGIVWTESVGPRYFETLGLRVLSGRDFRTSDNGGAPKVVAVNETAARVFFPGRNPVGLRMGGDRNRDEFEVIAVVADTQHATVRERPRVTVYLPVLQDPGVRETTIFVRSLGEATALAAPVRAVLREIDPTIPIMGVTTLEETFARSLMQDRLMAALSSCFGGLALVLAAIGLAGLLSFTVARRTREIGVRMALGATRGIVLRLVLRESLALVALGIALGVPLAVLAARTAEAMLFGLSSADPLTLGGAAGVLAVVALGAAAWPACRAARVDPLVALRGE